MEYIPNSALLRFGIVVLTVAFACTLMLLLDPWLGTHGTPFLLFFSAVMVSAWYGGLKWGLLATGLSALLSDYFFLSPRYELSLDTVSIAKMGLFAAQGWLFSILCEKLKNVKGRDEVNLHRLQVSEERFRLALSRSDITVFQQDRDLRYQWIHNPQGIATAEAILGKSDSELFPATIAEQLTAIKQRVIEHDVSAREEIGIKLRGETLYYDLLIEPLKVNGQIQGITCAGVNITDRKQAELEKAKLQQKLQQAIAQKDRSLALLNAWVGSSPVALAFLDTELRYVYANEALAITNGVPQDQHIGRTIREVLPVWAEQLEPVLYQVMQTREALLNQEVSGETYPPGVYRHGLVNYYPVCLPDGELLGVGVTGIDITQLKQTAQALRESEAKFRSVVESNMIGIGFWERDGNITEANDALLHIIGYSREEIVEGRVRWQDLTPPEYLPLDEQAIAQFQDSNYCIPFEKEYIRKDGSRVPIFIGGSHFEGTLERGAFFVLDITERKRAEEALRYIAKTSSTLASSLDYEATLEQIAKISVPQLADWCCVDVVEDGTIRRLPIAHVDPLKAEWARQLQQYTPNLQSASLIAKVIQTSEAILTTEISDALLTEATHNQAHLDLVRQMGIKSMMVLPLVAHEQVLGCMTFVTAESGRCYNQADLALAKDIAYRAALAVENAQLYLDIHQALNHYAESLSLLDALLAAAPVAICFLDRDLRYIRINQVLADINGLSVEEHLGQKFREVHPQMADEFEAQMQRVLDTGDPLLNLEINGEIPSNPGTYGYWLGNYYPVHNALGETVGIGIILADVTATKRAEIALRESEERFRAMFDQAAVGITLVTLEGKFLQINPALCEITGYSYEELNQKNFGEITHPDDLDADWVHARQVLAREINGYSLEKRYIRKDGSIVWVNITASAVWDDDGNPKYALGIIEDISERQAALQERQQAEATQNFLVAASTILAASFDYEASLNNVAKLAVPVLADWCVVDILQPDWSIKQIAIATAHPTTQELLAKIRQSYPPKVDDQHPFYATLIAGQSIFYPQLPEAILQAMAENEEHRQLLQNLEMRSLMVIPLYSRGRIFGVISFVTGNSHREYTPQDLALAEDIARRAATAIDNARLYQETQQAKQAAELAMSRTVRLQSITAALSEAVTPQQVASVVVKQGIAALDASAGSVVLLTEGGNSLQMLEAVGYPQSVRDHWTSFPISANVPIAETARNGTAIFLANVEMVARRYPAIADIPAQTGNCAFACIPLIVKQQTIGVLGLSFATAQTFNEEEQKFMLTLGQQCAQAIARAQLYEAEKNARAAAESANRIKDEFLTVLSHELRTPLNPIMGWAKLLRTRKYNESTVNQALETIERNAKLQTQLIDDLLDVSRILRGKLHLNICAVDLKTTINAALETVRLAAEAKSITVQTFLSDAVGQVMGDGDRLQQVVWNLLSNAVKFTPSEGRVEVYLQQVGREAQIQVIDTGKGITPEFLPHVFEYFRQADAKTTRIFGGLGLGLAIVRHLVELHGGTVQAESPGEDQGATFTVRLPIHKNAANLMMCAEASTTTSELPDSLLTGVNILLVDDQADVREFFSFALEQCGATVTTAASATEVLEILAQTKHDILLSDIGMPEMDGYMLLRQIRTWTPEQGGQIPAIALTAYAGEIDQNQALNAGFQKHIPKPADPADLAQAIVQILGDRRT
ncbi:PAS domain S-box protein [Nostoc sp. TCL26-01]|uniref:PAS domain S-box protein n=1 Tax=Nostoc sp. TCL26-01 TaxID=2576904 RepID=UPI0015B7DCD9|nr:PAS domain S-box protein [Nostoc sp. TCL26-01]QLE55731.1 PAS domain S-box protein [Nostoc sp. TCL26-01]